MARRGLGQQVGFAASVFALGAAVALACSGEGDPAPIRGSSPFEGGRPSTGGQAGEDVGPDAGGKGATGQAATGGAAGDAANAAKPPVVVVTSPEALDDPNGDGVLVEPGVDVLCQVTPASNDASGAIQEVSVTMRDAHGEPAPSELEGTVPAEPTGRHNEYSAHFYLSNVRENGRVSFECRASDSADPPNVGHDTVKTFVDHGPTIEAVQPVPGSPHALIGLLDVDFTVESAPVAKGDDGAELDQVTLEVGGVPFELAEDHGEYSANVDLTDSSLFPTTPSGEFPITIRAINKRHPKPGASVLSYSFEVDGAGPTIAVSQPPNGAVVGGRVPLVFTVTDDLAGVAQDSIVVELNGVENHFGEGGDWSVSGDQYTFKFDSTQIEGSKAQATVNIRAADKVGNDAEGESWLLYLDNVPPIVDLDPPNVRAYKKSGSNYICSVSFDPLGNALGDLADTNSRFGFFRALVWERTNFVPNQRTVVYSGTVESSVRLYIQPDPSAPFLVNHPGDADPACDDLDESALKELDFVHLDAVKPAGSAWFGADNVATEPAIENAPYTCQQGAESPPSHLCTDEKSDLSVVIAHESSSRPPAVFALGPLEGQVCTGRDWEIGSHAEEGWVCLAARALDRAGNVGISRPLRICYDDPETTFVPDCANASVEPPSCTDGCTLPPTFPSEFSPFVSQ